MRVKVIVGEVLELWFAALLGVVQGLTEFLPISSTAHLRVVPALLGQADPGAAFSAVIQLGTLLAVLVYFARDLFVVMPRALISDRSSPEGRLPWYIGLATLPIVAVGLTLKDFIKGDARSLYVIAAALALIGVVMWWADKKGRKTRELSSIRLSDALIVGLAQVMALIPGASRSGSTMLAALLLGFKRADAARFSFLLGIPAIGGAGILELGDAMRSVGGDAWQGILVGTFAAFVSGYASIAWLLRFLGQHSLRGFVFYRVGLAIFLLSLVTLRLVPAL